MKPVMMTSFGWPAGNCWAACVASIFEVSLSDVPVTSESGDWQVWLPPWQEWLAKRGFGLLSFPYDPEYARFFPGYCVLSNKVIGSPLMADGTELRHATVGLNGVTVHDPQPNSLILQQQQGCLQPVEVNVFIALDPARSILVCA